MLAHCYTTFPNSLFVTNIYISFLPFCQFQPKKKKKKTIKSKIFTKSTKSRPGPNRPRFSSCLYNLFSLPSLIFPLHISLSLSLSLSYLFMFTVSSLVKKKNQTQKKKPRKIAESALRISAPIAFRYGLLICKFLSLSLSPPIKRRQSQLNNDAVLSISFPIVFFF